MRATARVAPTQETNRERWFGKPRRKSGTAPTPIFHKPRAQWPGRNRTQALLILRAGNVLPTSRGNLRKMGSRGGEYEREALILSRALAPLWFLSGRPERNPPRRAELPLPPAGGEIPPARNETALSSPPHPSRLRRATFPYPLCRFATSPLDKWSRPPRGRLFWGALIRPLRGRLRPGRRLGRTAAPAAETGLLERNRETASPPLFPLFNFQLLC